MDSLLIYVILGFLYKIAENLKGFLCKFAENLKETNRIYAENLKASNPFVRFTASASLFIFY